MALSFLWHSFFKPSSTLSDYCCEAQFFGFNNKSTTKTKIKSTVDAQAAIQIHLAMLMHMQ